MEIMDRINPNNNKSNNPLTNIPKSKCKTISERIGWLARLHFKVLTYLPSLAWKLGVSLLKSPFTRKISKPQRPFNLEIGNTEAHNSALRVSNLDPVKHQLLKLENHEDLEEIKPKNQEWQLNFGLLHSLYNESSTTEEMKKKLRFFMVNYFEKSAALNHDLQYMLFKFIKLRNQYEEMLQISGRTALTGQYHRTSSIMNNVLSLLGLQNKIGNDNDDEVISCFPTDGVDITPLYQTCYLVSPVLKNAPESTTEISQFIVNHIPSSIIAGKNLSLKNPILIDVSPILGECMISNNQTDRMNIYKQKQLFTKRKLNEVIDKVAESLIKKYKKHNPQIDIIKANLFANLIVVARAELTKDIFVVNAQLDMFAETDYEKYPNFVKRKRKDLVQSFKEWAGHTGIAIGIMNFRRAYADNYKTIQALAGTLGRKAVVYTSHKPFKERKALEQNLQSNEISEPNQLTKGLEDTEGEIFFEDPKNLLNINLIKSLRMLSTQTSPLLKGQALLASCTIKMMETLLSSISLESWKEEQRNTTTKLLIENTTFRIGQHLSNALSSYRNFRLFSQAIDRIHCELTVLLETFRPFSEKYFLEQQKAFLSESLLPNELQQLGLLNFGIGKAAMNIFAGVIALTKELSKKQQLEVACGPHAYYEEPILLGSEAKPIETILEDSRTSVDLLLTEFHHNIDIDIEHTHYRKENIIQQIRSILEKNEKSKSSVTSNSDRDIDLASIDIGLTVAIDATIDYTVSEDLKSVFNEFKQEISNGSLHFIIFRSGQKFNMLGLDNYFGAPYYVVSNNETRFNFLSQNKVFNTDQLSMQFFSWVGATDPHLPDLYKRQIFSNTRAILDIVPPALKPESQNKVFISSSNADNLSPFIEICPNFRNNDNSFDRIKNSEFSGKLTDSFAYIFIKKRKLFYRRGSFGFAHPNITEIEPKIRINPGIDPNDITLFKAFFKKIESLIKQVQEQEPKT